MTEVNTEVEIPKGPRFGIRHVQILLLFLNITCVYMTRLNISVAVVAMTSAATTNTHFPEFNWSEKERNYIISSFFWGYIVTQFPAGYITRRFGAKTVLLCSTFFSASFTLLTPYLVTIGSWQAYCAIRVIQGLLQGALFPSINDHIAKWSPAQERVVLGAVAYSGGNCGTISSMFFTGLIASSPLGWPGISYVSGGLCMVWCVVWFIFGARNPPSSRFISKEECQYIEKSLRRDDDFHERKIPVPWVGMLTSASFLAMTFGRCSEMWTFSTVQNQIPSYLYGVMNLDIKSNGIYSGLPYIARWIMAYVYLFFFNMTVAKGWLKITAMRKVSSTMGLWIPSALLLVIGFLDTDNILLVVSLLVICVGFESGTATGILLSTIDLAPNHAGIVMGISNSIASLMSLISPLVVGAVVTDVHDRTEWLYIFGIAAGFGFVGNLVFLIYGSSEPAAWDAPDFLLKHNIEEPVKVSEHNSAFEYSSDSECNENDKKYSTLKI